MYYLSIAQTLMQQTVTDEELGAAVGCFTIFGIVLLLAGLWTVVTMNNGGEE